MKTVGRLVNVSRDGLLEYPVLTGYLAIDDTPASASTQVKPNNPGIVQHDDGNDSDGESSAESMDIEECSSD